MIISRDSENKTAKNRTCSQKQLNRAVRTSDFDFKLPSDLIAQHPKEHRDSSRLLIVERLAKRLIHGEFRDLADYLKAGDLLILNNSQVIPARVRGQKEGNGARVEILLTEKTSSNLWWCMLKPGKRIHIETKIQLHDLHGKPTNHWIVIKDKNDTSKTDDNLNPEDKIKELEDRLARAYAEIENQRRRFEKEKDDAFDYGGFALAKETLNLIDNLERSKFALENDESLKNSEELKRIVDHLNIIQKDMLSILKKNNIEEIKSLEQKLDPNLHQAMLEVEDDNKEVGTVVQEIQKGFMMKERLLRPALVAVSKKTINKEENLKKDEKSEENQSKSEEN